MGLLGYVDATTGVSALIYCQPTSRSHNTFYDGSSYAYMLSRLSNRRISLMLYN